MASPVCGPSGGASMMPPLSLTSFPAHICQTARARPTRLPPLHGPRTQYMTDAITELCTYLTVGFPCGTAMADEKSDAAGVRGVGGPPDRASNGFAVG